MLVACHADGSGSSLRGAGPSPSVSAAQNEDIASEELRMVGCSCGLEGACQCNRSGGSSVQKLEDEELERAVLERTRELMAWWQAQNETTRLMSQSWDGPLAEQTVELWHASASRVHVSGGSAHVRGGAAHMSGGAVHVSGGAAHVRGACGRRGGCGCVGGVGCGCAAHRGCVAVR